MLSYLIQKLNFDYFEKKNGSDSWSISEIIDSEMHKMCCFWKSIGSQHVNESLKLVQSTEKHIYPTFSSFWAKLS